MQEFIVKRSGQAPLRVRGEVVASVASSPDSDHPDYSWRMGQYAELTVYRTASGKFVAAMGRYTLWQGGHDFHLAAVFPTLREAVDWLLAIAPSPELDWLLEELPVEEIAEEVD